MALLPFLRRSSFHDLDAARSDDDEDDDNDGSMGLRFKIKEKKGKGCQCKFIRRQRVTMHQFRYGSHCSSECVVYGRLPHGQGNTTIAGNMHWEHHRGCMCLKGNTTIAGNMHWEHHRGCMCLKLSYGFTSSWILQSACAGNRTANRQADELARIRSDDDEDDDNSGSLGLRFKFNVLVKVFLLLSLSILVFKI